MQEVPQDSLVEEGHRELADQRDNQRPSSGCRRQVGRCTRPCSGRRALAVGTAAVAAEGRLLPAAVAGW